MLLKKNNGQVIFDGIGICQTASTSSSSLSTVPDIQNLPSQPPQQQSVNGYRGILPGNIRSNGSADNTNLKSMEIDDSDVMGTARTRPFKSNAFKKRKLLQSTNLHKISRRAARPW